MLQFPDAISFSMTPAPRKKGAVQRYDFIYRESFKDIDEVLMARTYAMVKVIESHDLKVRRLGKRAFQIKGRASRTEIATMLVGEFFSQSTIGSTTITEMWHAAVVGQMARVNIEEGHLVQKDDLR